MTSTKESIKAKLYTTNEYGYEYQRTDTKLSGEDLAFLKSQYHLNTDYARYNQVQPVHNMCVNCQSRTLMKFEKHPENKKPKDFQVKCNYVPSGLPAGIKEQLHDLQVKKGLDSKRALALLKSGVDPVAWCQVMFGFDDSDPRWRIRPYQKEMLRCTSQKYVIRAGRRIGKTFGLVLKLIHMLLTKRVEKGRDSDGNEIVGGPEILIITPYQAQVVMIFSEMEKIIKRNKDLMSEIMTGTAGSLYVKTPYFRMETKNGGKISGFVSGVGNKDDGSGGGTMRGQGADIIYLDEMDMIPDDIIEKVVVPILLTKPGVQLLISSTPIGKRSFFYNYSQNDTDFKEDYFPSTVLPHWDLEKGPIEKMYPPNSDAFKAEFMAAFIESGFGVFKPSYVFNARGAFFYHDCEINSPWWLECAGVRDISNLIFTMGIDWNKNAGTEIVVVAYDPAKHHWWIVDAVNVSAGEFTARRYMDEVIRLNYKWKPLHIYADEGYGHHIIDDLRLEAHMLKSKPIKNQLERETVNLGERLKAFNFSKTVVMKNPIDGTEIQKNGKEFLVQNAVRVFEEQRIWFPEDDATLVGQLMNYVDLGRNKASGKPIYGPDNDKIGDHRLDALMLALGALFLEESVYSGNQMQISKPGMLSKETLQNRAQNFNNPMSAKSLIMKGNESNVHLQVLNIRRGATDEEHTQVMKLYEAEQNSGMRQSRSRGDLGIQKPVEGSQSFSDFGLLERLRELASSGGVRKARAPRDRIIKRRGSE